MGTSHIQPPGKPAPLVIPTPKHIVHDSASFDLDDQSETGDSPQHSASSSPEAQLPKSFTTLPLDSHKASAEPSSSAGGYHTSTTKSSHQEEQEETEDDMAEFGLSPGQFGGSKDEDAEKWMADFESWVTYKGLSGEKGMAALALFMKKGAHEWFLSLGETQRTNWKAFSDAFRDRYLVQEATAWKEQTQIYEITQKPDQSVDDYITLILKKARKADVSPETLKALVLKGLKPNIRAHTMQHELTSIEEIKRWAKMAEASEGTGDTSSSSTQMAELIRTMKAMKSDISDLKPSRTQAIATTQAQNQTNGWWDTATSNGYQQATSTTPQGWEPGGWNAYQAQWEQPYQQQWVQAVLPNQENQGGYQATRGSYRGRGARGGGTSRYREPTSDDIPKSARPAKRKSTNQRSRNTLQPTPHLVGSAGAQSATAETTA